MSLLERTRIVDVHTHGWRMDEVAGHDQRGFLDRITMLGMCLMSSGLEDEALRELVELTTDTSPLAVAMADRMARVLDCEPTRDGIAEARARALSDHPAYLRRLWEDAGVDGLIMDDGYPLPKVDSQALGEEAGLRIHRVVRIEPAIVELRDRAAGFAELEDALTATLEQAAAEGAIAFKSVIAYRTGLDVRSWDRKECDAAYGRWRDDGWRESREHAKPVRDMLLRRTLGVACAAGIPVHIHCGGGDPSIVLAHAYLLSTVGAIRFLFFGRRRVVAQWEIVIPIAAIGFLVYTLYKNVYPVPSWPYNLFPYVVVAWLFISVAFVILVPGIARRIGDSLGKDEGLVDALAEAPPGAAAPLV